MANNIKITPGSGLMEFSGSVSSSIAFQTQADGRLDIIGKDGFSLMRIGPNSTSGVSFVSSSQTFTSQLRGPNGSVSAPAFSFSNDTDTGMYLGASSTLRFALGGADAVVLDATDGHMLEIRNPTGSVLRLNDTGYSWWQFGSINGHLTLTDQAGKTVLSSFYNTGKVGIGDVTSSFTPDGTLHVHTATAGAVTADANADDLVVEGSGATGISILAPNASFANLYFGSPSSDNNALIQMKNSTGAMNLGTAIAGGYVTIHSGIQVTALTLDANQHVSASGNVYISGQQLKMSANNPMLVLEDDFGAFGIKSENDVLKILGNDLSTVHLSIAESNSAVSASNSVHVGSDLTLKGQILTLDNASQTLMLFKESGANRWNFSYIPSSNKLAFYNYTTGATAFELADSTSNAKFNADVVVIGVVSASAGLEVDDTQADPLTIRRNGGTNANTAIRFQQASTSWYLGANNANVFALKYNSADLGVSPLIQVSTTGTLTTGAQVVSGSLTISGSLIVLGSTIEAQVTELSIEDKIITVASGSVNGAASDGAGIEVDRGSDTNVSMSWDNANTRFEFNSGLAVYGNTYSNGTVTLGNNQALQWPDALSGGSNRRVGLVSNGDTVFFGPIDTGWATSTYLSAGTDMQLRVNGSSGAFTTAISIPTTGNVGIGTTSPSRKLHVSSSDGSTSISRIAGSSYAIRTRSVASLGGYIEATSADESTYQPMNIGGSIIVGNIGGVEKFRFNSSGNLGIGTTSPLDRLHISGSGDDARMILDSATGFDSELKFFTGGNSRYTLGYNDSDSSFRLGSTNVDTEVLLYVTASTGNVGIGTTSPGAKLHVENGQLYVDNDDTNTTPRQITVRGQSDPNQVVYLGYNTDLDYGSIRAIKEGTSAMPFVINPTGGNVGIGTNNPSTKLHVSGSSPEIQVGNVGGNGQQTMLTDNQFRFYRNGTSYIFYNYADSGSGALSFRSGSGNADVMTLTSAGRVGIGTASPATLLHLSGSAPSIQIGNSGGNGQQVDIDTNNLTFHRTSSAYINYSKGGASGALIFRSGSNSEEVARFNASGQFGIGTSGAYKLDVYNGTASGILSRFYYLSGSTNSGGGFAADSSGTGRSMLWLDPNGADFASSDYFYIEKYAGGGNTVFNDQQAGSSMEFKLNGTGRFFISASGNVGIGTTNPQGKFTVISSDGTPTNATIGIGQSSNPTDIVGLNYAHNGNNDVDLLFGHDYSDGSWTTQMILTNAGYLGIGTTSPTSSLHVYTSTSSDVFPLTLQNAVTTAVGAGVGLKFVQGTTGSAGYILSDRESNYSGVTSNADSALVFATAVDNVDVERLRITSAGNVGIGGTPSSGQTLLVQNSAGAVIDLVRTSNRFRIETDETNMNIGAVDSGNIVFKAGAGSEVMRVDESGSLLIGNTFTLGNGADNSALQVKDKISLGDSANPYIYTTIENNAFGYFTAITANAHPANLGGIDSGFLFRVGSSSGGGPSTVMTISGSGNVGIGTESPSYKLHVVGAYAGITTTQGGYYVTNGTGDAYLALANTTDGLLTGAVAGDAIIRASQKLLFGIAGAGYMTMNATGSVGIGTTSPNYKLHISSSGGDGLKIQSHTSDARLAFVPDTSQASNIIFYQDDGSTQDGRIFTPEGSQTVIIEAGTTQVYKATSALTQITGSSEFSVNVNGKVSMKLDASSLVLLDQDDGGATDSNFIKLARRTGTGNAAFIGMKHDGGDGVTDLYFGIASDKALRVKNAAVEVTGSLNTTGNVITDGVFGFKNGAGNANYIHFDQVTGNNFIGLNDANEITLAAGGTVVANWTASGQHMTGSIFFRDSDRAKFGNASDLDIYHDGTDSFVLNKTGHLYLRNEAANRDVTIQATSSDVARFHSEGSASFGTATAEAGYRVNINGGLYVSSSVGGASVFKVEGTSGSLFEVVDSFDGVLMTVNDSSAVPIFIVSSSGQIGINQPNPTYDLDVNGTFRSTGTGSFDSGLIITSGRLSFPSSNTAVATNYIAVGQSAQPALEGALRIPNGVANGLYARNAGNSNSIPLIHLNSSDKVVLGENGTDVIVDTGDLTLNSGSVTVTGSLLVTGSATVSGSIFVSSNLIFSGTSPYIQLASGSYFKAGATQGFLINNSADTLNLLRLTDAGALSLLEGTFTLSGPAPAIRGSTTLGYLDLFGDSGATVGVRIIDTGDVRIGTGSAGSQFSRLFVAHTGAAPAEFNTTNASGGYVTLSTSGVPKSYFGSAGQLINGGSADDTAVRGQGALVFGTGGNTERLRITATGETLVSGSITVSGSANNRNDITALGGHVIVKRSDGARSGSFYADGTGTHLRSDASGNDPLYLRSPGTSGQVELIASSTTVLKAQTTGVQVTGSLATGTTSANMLTLNRTSALTTITGSADNSDPQFVYNYNNTNVWAAGVDASADTFVIADGNSINGGSARFVVGSTGATVSGSLTVSGSAAVTGTIGGQGLAPSSYAFNGDLGLVVGSTSTHGSISVVSSTGSSGYLSFADGTSGNARFSGQIEYSHLNNEMRFKTSDGQLALTLDSSQNATFAGNATVSGSLIVSGSTRSNVNALGNITTTATIDLSDADFVTATVTGDVVISFTNPPVAGGGFILQLTNGGSQAITWPASVKWPSGTAPTLTASGVDVLTFVTFDGGTTWRGVASQIDSQ